MSEHTAMIEYSIQSLTNREKKAQAPCIQFVDFYSKKKWSRNEGINMFNVFLQY